MKLWHDDWRPAPDDGWEVARTNEEAIALLRSGEFSEASLDFQLASFEETGLDLAKAMVELGLTPPRVNIHSWDGAGADAMATVLREGGCPDVTTEAAEI